MEQVNLVTSRDNERMIRMLSELLMKDKEFQIMITVPSSKAFLQEGRWREPSCSISRPNFSKFCKFIGSLGYQSSIFNLISI